MNKLNTIVAHEILAERHVQTAFDAIRSRISVNKAETTFAELTKLASQTNNELMNQLIVTQSRFNSWNAASLSGLNPAKSEMNIILSTLLTLVDRIESEISQPDPTSMEQLIEVMAVANKNLAAIRTRLEKDVASDDSFIGKIWIAMMPQLEGTMTSISKLLYVICEVVKLNEMKKEMKHKFKKDIIEIDEYSFANILESNDIDALDRLKLSVESTFKPSLKWPIASELQCYCGSGKAFIECHGKLTVYLKSKPSQTTDKY